MYSASSLFFFTALALTFILAGLLAGYLRRRRDLPGARAFFWLAVAQSLLAFAEILSLFAGSAGQALFWFKIRFVFSALMPVFWIWFALDYSGRKKWIGRRLAAGLFLIPVITQVMVWTNDRHHLFVKREVGFVLKGPFWIADTGVRTAGVWFLVHSFYGLILLFAGMALVTFALLKKRSRSVGPVFFINAAAFVAAANAAVSAFNLFPQAEFNPYTPGMGVSFLLVAIAVFPFRLFHRAPAGETGEEDVSADRSLAAFLFILIVLASGITAAGYVSFRTFQSNLRVQAENQLTIISRLKADELRDWRRERMADASLLQADSYFAELVERFLSRPSDFEARDEIQSRLLRYQAYRQYLRAYVVDMEGTARLTVPLPPRAHEAFNKSPIAVAEAIAANQAVLHDFHREGEESIHLSLYVPLVLYRPGSASRPLGAVVFWIDPAAHLYPYVLNWPGPSASAETLLVRRDGDTVLYVSDPKFRPGAALNLRLPLTRTEIPAVQAVLGREGIFEGKDDHGTAVLAFLRAVPESPWYLTVRMDLAEINAPARERLWQMILMLAALITALGAALRTIWRRQRLQFFRSRAEIGQKLRDSLERFELANKATFDIIWDWNLQTGTYWLNENFHELYGYTPAETEPNITSWIRRIHPDDRDRVVAGIRAVIDGGEEFWSDQYRFLCKDGRSLEIFDRGFVTRDGAGKPLRMIGAMQDISEQRKAESALSHFHDLMRYIIEHNRSAVAVHDRNLRFLYVSQRYLDDYRVKEKDVIGKRPDDVFSDFPGKWSEIYQKGLAGLISSAEDDPYPRADGTTDWTRWECRPWYEADGAIGGIIVYTEIVNERKKADEAIRASLREKEVLLKEIHHRVKNNMQVISSLLSLQAAQFNEDRFRDAMRETQRRIRSMALLHEKLYKSRDLSRIDFVEYARSLATHLLQSHAIDPTRITLRFEMEPVFFDLTTANPLGLILNEFLSNAMKHAFPGNRKGEIFVSLRRRGDEYLLHVRDDGIGLPEAFDPRGKESFGIQIIDALVHQLNGRLRVEGEGAGATFELAFRELVYGPRLDPALQSTDKS